MLLRLRTREQTQEEWRTVQKERFYSGSTHIIAHEDRELDQALRSN
jgi:hypothetical protein